MAKLDWVKTYKLSDSQQSQLVRSCAKVANIFRDNGWGIDEIRPVGADIYVSALDLIDSLLKKGCGIGYTSTAGRLMVECINIDSPSKTVDFAVYVEIGDTFEPFEEDEA